MKIFHISDLHIGLKLHNRDMKEDQAHILSQIAEHAAVEQPDAILIAGDIYDKAVPSADAAELFDDFITRLSGATPDAEIMMISGNHDSGVRIDTYRNILRHHRIHVIGTPPCRPDEFIERVTLSDEFGEVDFYLLPFVRPSMIRLITGTEDDGTGLSYDEAIHRLIEREDIDQTRRNVLVSHQFYLPEGSSGDDVERMDSERVTVGNIDAVRADVLEQFDYAALGHIHKPMRVGSDRYRYCGTPMACSVSEAGQEKAIIVVELNGKESSDVSVCEEDAGESETNENTKSNTDIKIKTNPLEPLHQVRVIIGKSMEVLAQGCDDLVSVVLTDEDDLDVIDIQDRLRYAFPNLLEIKREGVKAADYSSEIEPDEELDPFDLCRAFLGELDDEDISILGDVINEVQGVSR